MEKKREEDKIKSSTFLKIFYSNIIKNQIQKLCLYLFNTQRIETKNTIVRQFFDYSIKTTRFAFFYFFLETIRKIQNLYIRLSFVVVVESPETHSLRNVL